MVSEIRQREVPCCTIFLVVGAVAFQTITFIGNCKTGTALNHVGYSVSGWSLVGLGLSKSFGIELNNEAEKVQADLTESIVKIHSAEHGLDGLLSVFGAHVDQDVHRTVSLLMQQEELGGDPMGTIMGGVRPLSDIPELLEVNGQLVSFMNEITPALEVVGTWNLKFGPKIQAYISQMGTTIDRSQLNFDKIMQHLMSSTGEDRMAFETFNLYDMAHTGSISLSDVHDVGNSYAINAYQGVAGTKLFNKYAGNNSLIEKGPEFEAFVSDPATPLVMAILLRSYAKLMAQAGGLVGKAVKRIDMSYAVSQFLQLTCARNLTRVEWVAQMLTNGTLPIPFTATVLVQLALEKDNPNALTTVDIGEMSVGAMVTNNLTAVLAAADQLHSTEFFSIEGFDVSTQPRVLQIVSAWILNGAKPWKTMVGNVGLSTLEVADTKSKFSVSLLKIFEEMPKTARRLSQANVQAHKKQKAVEKIVERQQKFSTKTQETLLLHLTGGRSMSDMVKVESAAAQVVNGGVDCTPVTMEWAKWLSANASSISQELYSYSADYAKTSSSTTDSFNTQVQGITKKIISFIGVMESYSTPAGIALLKEKIERFEPEAMKDVLAVVEKTLVKLVKNELVKLGKHALGSVLGNDQDAIPDLGNVANVSLCQGNAAMKTQAGSHARASQILAQVSAESERRQAQQDSIEIPLVWSEVQTIMSEAMNLMPSAVNTITTAKQEIQMVSSTLESMFTTLGSKGPGIFGDAAFMYKVVWILYFFLLTPFTLGILVYSFWASGFCGGPKAYDTTEYEAPKTCGEYMSCVCRGCCACMTGCCDSSLCFWSFIIVMQIMALLLFIMSILFTIIGGIDIFLATGCNQIYVITDDPICQTSMSFMQQWLSSFSVGDKSGLNPLTEVCGNHNLLLCQRIQNDLMGSATWTIVGSFVACIFTFQLIFDTAILHERARWHRMIDEMTKDG